MARTVQLRLNYAPRGHLVDGPSYTITEDPPWLQTRADSSDAIAEPRASSTYSVQLDDLTADMAEAAQHAREQHEQQQQQHYHQPPSSTTPEPSFSPDLSFSQSMRQDSMESNPQARPSRVPIFKQVRSMLTNNRAASGSQTSPTSAAIKWDEYSGEISEHGKEAKVKPSNYKNPYEGILKSRRQPQSPTRNASGRQQNPARMGSPVSMLVDEDLHMLEQHDQEHPDMSPPVSRPVSPVSVEPIAPMHLEPPSARPKTSGDVKVKRKPVAATSPRQETFAAADVRQMPNSSHGEPSQTEDPASRFSWTTVAHSDAAALRKSTDTRFSRQHDSPQQFDHSHFSWSTTASAAPAVAGAMREQTPPPSPPPVPPQYLEPPVYGPPPTQSILSRQRPYKRIDKPEWAPPPAPVTEGYTPRSLTPKVHRVEEHWSTTPTLDGKKRLPLPPLFTEKSLSHLEALLTQEKNILLQRRNIERHIIDLERIENASPLEVSFSQVREARKKLEEQRKVLDEVRREEMDIGIKIARARRKEDFGDGEGTFWVRRVTG